jgi:protein-glutamine gamma-glutamyltransferase
MPVSVGNFSVLLLGIALTVAPQITRLPAWVTVIVAAMVIWRTRLAIRQDPLPRKWLLFALVVTGVFALYAHYRTLIGRDVGVSMLVLFLGLKMLETRTERDVVVVTFLCYFLLLTNFFYSQSPATGLHMAATVIVLTAALVGFNASHLSWQHTFKASGLMVLQGVPIAIALFVLFPRFDGPIWALPDLNRGATIGLSDSMSPGTVSRLSQSDAIAFRAKFDAALPPRSMLYWRGPVFPNFDGRTWSANERVDSSAHLAVPMGQRVDYEVTVEPHDRNWLFALEMPTQLPAGTFVTTDGQLLANKSIRNRLRYRTSSALQHRVRDGTTPTELRAALALPEGFNPKSIALGIEWRQALRSDRAIIERSAAYFASQGLRYTIAPPILGRHTVDEFLFETKLGFCEHFASAFVVLMRAASIPARVVTGYQGGTINPIDGNLTVRQADAHAWAEVWLEDSGWLRIDPTASAAPARVEGGIAAAIPLSEALPFMIRPDMPFLAGLRHNWEALLNNWNQWVLGYDAARQQRFLQQLGMPSASLQTLLHASFIVVSLGLLVVTALLLRGRSPRDPIERQWLKFCRRLAAAGTVRLPSEGPLDYAIRAAGAHPDAAASIHHVAKLYIVLRYGQGHGAPTQHAAAINELTQSVASVKLQTYRIARWMRTFRKSSPFAT